MGVKLKRVAKFFGGTKTDKEVIVLFKGVYDGPFKINKKECERVEFFRPDDVYRKWKKGKMKLTPGGAVVLEYIVKNSEEFEVK